MQDTMIAARTKARRMADLADQAQQSAALIAHVVGDGAPQSSRQEWGELVVTVTRQQFEYYKDAHNAAAIDDHPLNERAIDFQSLLAMGNATGLMLAMDGSDYTDRDRWEVSADEYEGSLIGLAWMLQNIADQLLAAFGSMRDPEAVGHA